MSNLVTTSLIDRIYVTSVVCKGISTHKMKSRSVIYKVTQIATRECGETPRSVVRKSSQMSTRSDKFIVLKDTCVERSRFYSSRDIHTDLWYFMFFCDVPLYFNEFLRIWIKTKYSRIFSGDSISLRFSACSQASKSLRRCIRCQIWRRSRSSAAIVNEKVLVDCLAKICFITDTGRVFPSCSLRTLRLHTMDSLQYITTSRFSQLLAPYSISFVKLDVHFSSTNITE